MKYYTKKQKINLRIIILFLAGSLALKNSFAYTYVGGGSQQPDTSFNNEFDDSDDGLPYSFSDKPMYDYSIPQNDTGLFLSEPSNIESSVEYDPEENEYIIKERIGDFNYRPPRSLSIDEYKDMRFERSLRNFWHQKARGGTTGSKSLIPQIHIGSKVFGTIFGSNTIDIKPQGQATLIFGINVSKINNPNLQERLRTTTTFDFEEKIQMNVSGKIGDKVEIGINYDTEATFDFENKTKLGYSGDEDEIIQEIQVGNVTLPLEGSLIRGSQNLFGIKTKMQFGHLTVTSVFSQKKGRSQNITVEGGAQKREFEVRADEYDENRHFFLSHFFRDNYNEALKLLPVIRSGITITKLEIWVTNTSDKFSESRNIIALTDLGETAKYRNDSINIADQGLIFPDNSTNTLYSSLIVDHNIQDTVRPASNKLGDISYLEQDKDFIVLENARLLSNREYTLHPQLGYVSLNRTLNADDILAVAFEYNYRGKTYQVGNLSKDIRSNKTHLLVKMLKSTSMSPQRRTWNLMMKNVYSLDAFQVEKNDFMFQVLYENPKTGTPINYIPEPSVSDTMLLQVMNLDNADIHLEPFADGMFDYINNVTIIPSSGKVIFPVLEPFGSHLREFLSERISDPESVDKYVFDELYDSTITIARQAAKKNKFIMEGSYKSSSGSEISLNAMNIPEGSVKVTAGGIPLQENKDYTVDYQLGRVKILNSGLLESGRPINISLESNTLYNMQTKTMIGTHLNYQFNDKFHIGGTILNLTERPLTKKVDFGNEPISNTMYGFNGSYSTESQFLTTMVDKIPFIDAKQPSSVTVSGEFAHLIPGHSRAIEKEGNAYIDDFEASETEIDVKSFPSWVIASTPQYIFPEASLIDSLAYNYNRAMFAWYVIDPLFLRNKGLTPNYMRNNPEYQCSHFVREIYQQEIFPERNPPSGMPSNIPVLNLAYYPMQKGPYNYDAASSAFSSGVDENGLLNDPETRWGGIMRELPTTDFEEANIQYIDFWLMDPFVENKDADGGQLYFNLGEISEDILKDSRKMFEQGLPPFGTDSNDVIYTSWGRIPDKQALVNAFQQEGREYQDVGLDGLDNEHERTYFQEYLEELDNNVSNVDAYNFLSADPSSDDFFHYRNQMYDDNKATILQRYKYYNGLEGNSPDYTGTGSDFNQSASTLPDIEDINRDNTLNKGQEAYFEYMVNITPDSLKSGMNFITDSVRTKNKEDQCSGSYVTWYHFRIPIKSYQARRGPINDFRSIRFMRMFLTGFEDSVYFRFATLDLVRSEWRRYERPLVAPGEALTIPEPLESKLTIGSVNIEENSKKDPVNYILPPGVDRVIDPADPQLRQLNEQSIVLKVDNLQEGESKAAYKTSNIDIREYKKLEMFVHAEEVQGYDLNDNELYAFIRLGADYTENYYEYEIPLELTPPGNYQNGNVDSKDREIVWKNRFDINLDDLPELKIERNKKMRQSGSGVDFQTVYSIIKEKAKISVRGNPNLSDVKTIMIGLRNPQDFGNTGRPITAEVWMNELRLSHFREEGGWAANARVTTNLSDFATLDLAGSTVQPGFGSIEKKPNERSKEQIYRADASSNIALGKFFPQKAGIRLPMYLGYSTEIVNPQYNPLEPDVEFKKSLNSIDDEHARDSIRRIAQDRTVRKSINFTNVGISGKGKPKIYSPSNFSFNFAYSEMRSHSITVDTLFEKQYSGGLVYNYNTRPRPVTPFTKMIKSNNLRLIRDFNFNYYPSQLTFRTSLERRYREKKMRNLSYSNVQLPWTVEKNFIWNRDYGFKWDLTRSLKLNYSANNRARIDEEPGRYRKGVDDYQLKKDTIIKNLKNFGRTIQYRHKVSGSYNLPINKIGFLNWTSVNLNYDGTYSWDAGPQFSKAGKAYEGINLGNTINNSNNIQARGNLRLTRLYNKIGFLERINKGRKKNQQELKEVEYKDDGVRLREGRSKNIYHKLGTEDVQVWVTDAKGDEIEGDLEIVNSNRVKFTPESDYNNANIKVVGKVKKGPNLLEFMGRTIARTAMSVRDISVSISRNKGMTVPGYQPKTEYLGMNKNFNAPTVPFILGWVDDDISGFYEQAKNNWLAQDVNVIDPLMVTKTERINIRSNIEPIDGIKISLTANRTYSENNNYYYTYDTLGGFPSFNELPKNIQGNFSMSYMSIGSAFENPNKDNNWHSDAFNNFKKYRKQIADRLAQQRLKEDPTYDDWQNRNYFVHPELQDTIYKDASYPMGYGRQSQEVLIPAFLAAYGDKSPGKITLANFPKWYEILPNWRIRINKLTEIDWIKERFRSVSINHSYSSTYSVGSFINNPEYLGYTTDSSFNMQGDFITKYNINGISLSEQFRPLIGIDMTFENGLNLSTQWQKSRTLSLSFSNNRLTEVLSNEFSVGAGYRFDEVPLILNLGGGDQEAFETNLRINADFGIRKNINILRDLDGSTPEVSRGQEMFTFELSADYALSSRFNLRFFVDRQEVNPFISNTYARKNTNIGFSVTFTLAN